MIEASGLIFSFAALFAGAGFFVVTVAGGIYILSLVDFYLEQKRIVAEHNLMVKKEERGASYSPAGDVKENGTPDSTDDDLFVGFPEADIYGATTRLL